MIVFSVSDFFFFKFKLSLLFSTQNTSVIHNHGVFGGFDMHICILFNIHLFSESLKNLLGESNKEKSFKRLCTCLLCHLGYSAVG